MSTRSIKIILGLANVGDRSQDSTVRYDKPEEVNAYLNAFHARGGRQIDTARNYSVQAPGTSEERLGAVAAGERFLIDTKVVSFVPGSHAEAKIDASIDASAASLKVSSVNVEYLHVPDRATPFIEPVRAMDRALRSGKFKAFGLSNYTAAEVDEILRVCEEGGFQKPTVYQGQYNAIVRSGEKELFPLLRKHGIAFYAWSPAAGGFFAANHKHVKPGDRFDTSYTMGQVYSSGYLKDDIIAAADRVIKIIAAHGISGHAAALRWAAHHSKLDVNSGDAIIIAASSVAQLHTNVDAIEEGPLPAEVVHAMDGIYGDVAGSEFPYHF